MPYPPFPVDVFGDLGKHPKKELKDRLATFLAQIPSRLETLEREVRREQPYGAWHADRSPESLVALGDWFASNVRTRPRTAGEIAAIEAGNPYPIEVDDYDLTVETQSMAADVGICLAETLRAHHAQLEWTIDLSDRRFIDYGKPVLAGFSSRVPMNAVAIAVVLAYGIVSKRQSGGRLLELYRNWSEDAAGKWSRS